MKVGDLVKCINANGIVGLVTKTILNTHNSLVYVVLVGGEHYPFRAHQLEVINESR
jgi:hypothetical protein